MYLKMVFILMIESETLQMANFQKLKIYVYMNFIFIWYLYKEFMNFINYPINVGAISDLKRLHLM